MLFSSTNVFLSDPNFNLAYEFSTEVLHRVIRRGERGGGCRNKKNLDSLIFLIVSNIYNERTKAIVQVIQLYRVRFPIPCSKNNSRGTAEIFFNFFILERNIRATTSFINFCTWKRIICALYTVGKSNLRDRISNNEHLINGIKRKQKMRDNINSISLAQNSYNSVIFT